LLLLLCLAPGHPCNAAPKPRGGGTTPPGRGNGRLLPVLDNGNPREPSADRAESTDSPDGPDSTGWDWDVTTMEGSLTRIGLQHAYSAEWMHAEVRHDLGNSLVAGVSVESWSTTSVQQAPLGQSVRESGIGPTTVRLTRGLAGVGEGHFAMAVSSFVRVPGARAGPGPRTVEAGVSLPLEVPLGENTRLGAMVASNLVPNAISDGRHLEGVASLAVSHDFWDPLSGWIEAVSVSSGGDRPWLGVLNAGFSLEAVPHIGLMLGASGGIGGGTTDVGLFGRVNVHH